jgi:hypothetical protein
MRDFRETRLQALGDCLVAIFDGAAERRDLLAQRIDALGLCRLRARLTVGLFEKTSQAL